MSDSIVNNYEKFSIDKLVIAARYNVIESQRWLLEYNTKLNKIQLNEHIADLNNQLKNESKDDSENESDDEPEDEPEDELENDLEDESEDKYEHKFKTKVKQCYISYEKINKLNSVKEDIETDFKTWVLIDFGDVYSLPNFNKFTFDKIEPIFRIIPRYSQTIWVECCHFMGTIDEENKHMTKFLTLAEECWNYKTRKEMLIKMCHIASDYENLCALYSCKPKKSIKIYNIEKYYSYQQNLFDLINNTEPSDRQCIWIFDKNGSSGKSYFASFLEQEQPNKIFHAKNLSDKNLSCEFYRKIRNEAFKPRAVFVDISHYKKGNYVYDTTQNLLDGCMTTTKNEVVSFTFETPHVIVFANFLPKLKNFSQDRWGSIYKLEQNKNENGTLVDVKMIKLDKDTLHYKFRKADFDNHSDSENEDDDDDKSDSNNENEDD